MASHEISISLSKTHFFECLWFLMVFAVKLVNQRFFRQQIIENSWGAYKSSGLAVLSRASAERQEVDMCCSDAASDADVWFSRLIDVETFLRKVCGVHEDWRGAGNDGLDLEKMSLHQQKWQRRWWGWTYIAWKQSEGRWRCPHDIPWQQKDWIITNTIKSLGSAVHTSFRRYTLFIKLRMNLNEWSLLLANRKEVFHFGVRPFFGDNRQYVLRHWAEI